MSGINRHKNLKCFRKDKRNLGELSCPPTGLIIIFVLTNIWIVQIYEKNKLV